MHAAQLDFDGCSTDGKKTRRCVVDGGTHDTYEFCRRFGLSGITVAGPEANHYDPDRCRSVVSDPDIGAASALHFQNG